MPDSERRRKVMRFSDTVWPMIFDDGQHAFTVSQGLPSDARAVGIDFDGRTIRITFESSTFDKVPDGDPFPEIETEFRENQYERR